MNSFKITATPPKEKKKKNKYPWIGYLKENPKVIVLFTSKKHGIYLTLDKPDSRNQVGLHYGLFVENLFLPYVGKITIDCEE